MRSSRWIAAAIVLAALTCAPVLAQTSTPTPSMTWAENLQAKIDSLGMSDGQRTEIRNAFEKADKGYDEAILVTRNEMASVLTADQKTKLGAMADTAIQNHFSGKDVDTGKSISEIGKELGITKEQRDAFKDSLKRLDGKLDTIDQDLTKRVKEILRPDQIEKIKSWLM